MNPIAEEIQRISDNADKCINYPIGDKLVTFLRQQEESNCPNFVLSGVLIYAAAKIFGRKVDCLEQEILGVAKNFEQVEAETGKGSEREPKEGKKARTKKYIIKDSVNIDKILFEEKEIILAMQEDINKALAEPSKISRLQKMKDFFARNKEKSGKIAIPKSMLLSNEIAITNFGGTQIHDYDDFKDIVGSRRDFTSFSFFINSCTGELQNDLNFSKQLTKGNDYLLIEHENHTASALNDLKCDNIAIENDNINISDRNLTISTRASIDLSDELLNGDFTPPSTPLMTLSGKVTPINLNLDEGIEMDIDQSSLIMPIQPTIKLFDFLRTSPNLFPESVHVNESVEMNFSRSVLTVLDEIKSQAGDFSLPEELKKDVVESRMKNIFMIPIKKLKHKCLFSLPDSEFRELKRRKLDQHKSTVAEQPNRQNRIFKFLDLLKKSDATTLNSLVNFDDEDENTPFLGFSKDEQNESRLLIQCNNHSINKNVLEKSAIDISLQTDSIQTSLRKASNDSGYTSEYMNSSSEIENSTTNQDNTSILNSIEEENGQKNNNSGTDSCYQSLASGQSLSDESSTLNIPSFIDEFQVGNSTENELETSAEPDEQSSLESEDRILQMKQLAMNVAKWKDFLKPVLAQSEKRSKIDMHEYGLRVINKIGNVNDSKTLREISDTDQMPAYFFTMLQLTNNRNIDLSFTNKSIDKPTALEDIKLTLRSKTVHKEKFDEMGQHFEQVEELKKVGKRKGQNLIIQTSTPAKRSFIPNVSLNFDSPNLSQSIIDNSMKLSQASSGYHSQNSIYSDF